MRTQATRLVDFKTAELKRKALRELAICAPLMILTALVIAYAVVGMITPDAAVAIAPAL